MDNQVQEKWLPIPNYSGYEISNFGKVRSIDRLVNRKNGSKHLWRSKIISPTTDSSGYYQVKLTNISGIRKAILLHRIVALVFLQNENIVGLEVNHIDGNKKNNLYNNLEWVTPIDNKIHALNNGLIKRGSDLPYSKPVLDLQTGVYYDSITEAAIARGIKNRTLHHWLFGDRKNKSSLILV